MATERKPWPIWASTGYYSLRAHVHGADKKATQALEIQHQNVYLLSRLLTQLFDIGQKINAVARETQQRKGGDDEQWPKWANEALRVSRKSGLYIKAGAKHALGGLNLDGSGDENWKQVITGLNTCIDHIYQIETALLAGPQPEPDISECILDTLTMGESTTTPEGGRWRRRRRY